MEEYAIKLIENGLSIPYSELYTLTLPEISAAVRGYNTRIRTDKVMFGTLTAAIYNTAFGRKGKALKWTDVFPDDESCPEYHGMMSAEQMSAKLHSMFGGA